MKTLQLTDREVEELLKLIAVADGEYIRDYGGSIVYLTRAEKKLREAK